MKLPIAPVLDRLLGGGLEPGCITNFYGPPASGKTQICMCACVSALKSGRTVVYIDTEGGFSFERLNQIYPNPNLKKLILLEPKGWGEQMKIIRSVPLPKDLGLVIVDSMVALWRITINENNAQKVNQELATQLSILSRIARERNIPVVITTQVYADTVTGKMEISSRNIVKWWSKNLIELTHSGRTGQRTARIVRARSLPEDTKTEFQITEHGLKEPPKLRFF
ncbi:MAG: DNA repair and recombination protein RadB [Candidatus Micrarchaeota archaeon]|nr:DNA repair and recombination protein RadB [Candidatus Micrarchaeota archaeon]